MRMTVTSGGQYIVLVGKKVVLRTFDYEKSLKFLEDFKNEKDKEFILEMGKFRSDAKKGQAAITEIDFMKVSHHNGNGNNWNHGYRFHSNSSQLK